MTNIYREGDLFILGEEDFPITVDYGLPLYRAWDLARKKMAWWGDIEMLDRSFKITGGVHDFVSFFAVLQRNDYLWELAEDCAQAGFIPADMRQFFAFCENHLPATVSKEQSSPIVAAAPGSTWRCSHNCLHELVGVEWDDFYHNPGPSIGTHTNVQGFEKGTRFLAIRQN